MNLKLERVKKMSEWVKVNLEKVRTIAFKSDKEARLHLTNVTHYKKRSHGFMLKCDQGVVYIENDDVSHIISDCEDWIV